MSFDYAQYLRHRNLPHIWCPGCAHGTVMKSILRAIDRAGLDQDRTVVVSGIGCASRLPGYLDFNTLHTTHGRALAFATGIKLAKPELSVIVVSGDGDALAIGGNHFIHACRRNIDLTLVVFNNNIYGMTGGQFSPTTPTGRLSATTPFGNPDPPFDTVRLAMGAGASYVARGTAYHVPALDNLIHDGIRHPGFAVIEALCTCPTTYGRRNKLGSGVEMLEWLRDNTMGRLVAEKQPPEKSAGKILTGVFLQEERAEYCAAYDQMRRKVMQKG